MDLDTLFDAAMAGDTDATAKLEMEADTLFKDEETILHLQSQKGNTERVRFILREFAHKNLLTKLSRYKHSALHLAIYRGGHTQVAQVLIDAARHLPPPPDNDDNSVTSFQAFLRQGDKDMDTALHAAVKYGHLDIVKLLVEADPTDTHIQNYEGKTPMYIAVEQGLSDIAEIIFKTCTAPSLLGPHGSTVVRIKNQDQGKSHGGTAYKIMDRYAFYVAAIEGDADAIHNLEVQADIFNRGEETILHVESQNKYAERVRVILREFAKKNLLATLITSEEQTALHLAAINGHAELAEILIDAARHLPPSDDDNTRDKPVTSFQAFLRQPDLNEDTALHAAVLKGQAPIVKLLVEADPSDTHIQNDEGKTPMYIAVEKGFNDIAEMISTTCSAPSLLGPDCSSVVLNKNFDQAKIPGGILYKIMRKDALYAAAIAGDADAIAALEMHADKLDINDRTILHIESREGNTEHVRFILRGFAHKNLLVKQDDQMETALTWAAYYGHTEVAKVLIDAAKNLPFSEDYYPITSFQAFLRLGDKDKDTALHIAVIHNKEEIVKLLVEADPSDTHTQNNEGKTPMYIAVDKGFNGIAEIISTTCTAPSLDGPDGSTVVRINNLEQGKSPGGTLFKIMDRYAFFVAAIAGDADAIAKLETEADIPNEGEETILHVESQNGYTERVRFILKEFAKKYLLSPLDSDEHTALHLAANNGHTEVAEILIDVARHLYPSSDNDNTHKNPRTSIQAFLRQSDLYEDTALHAAVKKGHGPIVKLLVEADPSHTHTQNDEGKTPMYIAVEKGFNDIAEIISTTCTAPSLLGPDCSSVVRNKNFDQAESPGGTLYKIMHKDVLYSDAIAGDADAIAALEMHADKLDGYFEETILHTESKMGNTEHVQFILKDFAHKNLLVKLNRYKQTALHLASYEGHTEVAEILINAAKHLPPPSLDDDDAVTSFQAFLRQADNMMETALHKAVKKGNVAIVKLIVEADPSDSHTRNSEGETAIYIAAERGYYDMVKMISTTCTPPLNLDGPGGTTTVLHILIDNLDKGAEEEGTAVIKLIIKAVKHANKHGTSDERDQRLMQFFNRTDEKGRMILELAVEGNHLDLVKLILAKNPGYGPRVWRMFPELIGRLFELTFERKSFYERRMYPELMGIMPLIYKVMEREKEKENNDMVNLLTQTYERVQMIGFQTKANVHLLISDMDRGDEEYVLSVLNNYDIKELVTFHDNLGWTALHHAVYYQHNLIMVKIIQAQKRYGHGFVYPDRISTPFHIAVQKGYMSTLEILLRSWPASSLTFTGSDKKGQNILHLAALQSGKEMILCILKHCPEVCKEKFVNKKDDDGDTPLHLLIGRGCFIPEFCTYKGLDTGIKNKKQWTPRDMLYFEDEIMEDQVQIKIILDGIQTDPTRDNKYSRSVVLSRRLRKDVIFNERAKLMIHEKYTGMKEDHDVIASCFTDAIGGDPISKAALRMKADKLNKSGETILHVESKKGDIENVRFIVIEFAKKNLLGKRDRLEQTAFHLAAQNGHTQVVEALIHGARLLPSSNDCHVQNSEGKTPIYIAAENGYKDIVKVICRDCKLLVLDGPGGRTTALHALIQNIDRGTEGECDVIGMMVDAAKRWSSAQDFEALFSRTDELGRTVLQIAVERKDVNAVKLILKEDPANQPGGEMKRNCLMRLICKAIDDECSDDIINALSETYKAGIIDHDPADVLDLIRAIQELDKDSVLSLLRKAKKLVTFKEDNGWTPLHYAVYYEFDAILDALIREQKDLEHPFDYENMEATPFYVAIERGYTSTLVRLLELWPDLSSDECSPYTLITQDDQNILHMAIVAPAAENRKAVAAAADSGKEMVQMELRPALSSDERSPYTFVTQDGQNTLHMAVARAAENRKAVAVAVDNQKAVADAVDNRKAAANRKEMVQSILKYCPNKYKDKILKQKDKNDDTPLHLLNYHGCFIPGLIKHKGINTMERNKRDFTPRDMLYVEDATVADQVHIKIALDEVLTSKSGWKLWGKRTEKKADIWRCNKTPPSKRKEKDVKFEEEKKTLEKQRTKDRKTYKMRTNTQILVTALITTVTFTVGFTMPGGLHQSGEVDEGLVVLSKKRAFNVFMVSDALALLMSTSSLFFYFLESMNEDIHQVSLLNASSTVLNILSISAMMVTFIAGTYVVLSETPVLAIAICIIGSLFFLLILILWIIKIVFDRYKRNKD
ncbi:uncharacterized protein LOC108210071 isoform X2 [Daucus carota subsp. sativus]|uniref:uncharacterized protein LOC108210071 isoform X2 n=1 Tax=Daucus carota subsp. sativus TaxID=79200 RepID=UPI0007EF1493|nr:PREDICTED: uncharacterized protein LOC108210071 isoform X2 [Daucus carota subsp. sativus]